MKVAIIGRPNVGKSTLFNRLAGAHTAIAGDLPGITRDRKSAHVDLWGIKFQLIDTPGVDTFSHTELAKLMNSQSLEALKESDSLFFVTDAIEGVTDYDKEISAWIRSAFKNCGQKPVIVIANKCDGKLAPDSIYSLGFGESVNISAEHNLGFDSLYEKLNKLNIQSSDDEKEERPDLRVAIVGRPNVGKSTLINAIIGQERLLTGDIAGLTRDSIALNWKYKGRNISLVDTAGQRKKSKVNEKVEFATVKDAWKHINRANVVVVVMDIRMPLERQDVLIAQKAFDEGKIVIFALNKSDLVENPKEIQKEIERRTEKEFAQLPGVPCILVSAKEKLGLARIFNIAIDLHDKWSQRFPTNRLNKWFQCAIAQNPPPLVNGMPIKLKYVSQTNSRPPSFVVFANRSEHLPTSYERYLTNHLRKSFDLFGVPLRIFVRQRKNPFVE